MHTSRCEYPSNRIASLKSSYRRTMRNLTTPEAISVKTIASRLRTSTTLPSISRFVLRALSINDSSTDEPTRSSLAYLFRGSYPLLCTLLKVVDPRALRISEKLLHYYQLFLRLSLCVFARAQRSSPPYQRYRDDR